MSAHKSILMDCIQVVELLLLKILQHKLYHQSSCRSLSIFKQLPLQLHCQRFLENYSSSVDKRAVRLPHLLETPKHHLTLVQ